MVADLLSPANRSLRSFRSVAFAESRVSDQSSKQSTKAPKDQEISRVIRDMNMAVTNQQRKASVHAATKLFNHRNKNTHNRELELGAANALYQKLMLSLASPGTPEKDAGGRDGSNNKNHDDKVLVLDGAEIAAVCAAFEMVYRCSSSAREKSFGSIGTELTTVFLQVIERCECSPGNTPKIPRGDADTIITNILSVFQYFSRVHNISTHLSHLPGVLPSLALIVSSNHRSDPTRAAAMSTLADLACAESNGAMMSMVPGLFDSVIDVAYLDHSNETREAAARAIQNIVFSVENRVPSIKFEKLVKALMLLQNDPCEKTRKYASGALQNLTTWEGCQVRLVRFDGGILLDSLVKVVRGERSSDSSEARIRALGAVINLINEKTCGELCSHEHLLETLSTAASSDRDSTIRRNAADALCWLAEDFPASFNGNYSQGSRGQQDLWNALLRVAKTNNVNGVARALYEQSQHTENREHMANHPGMLEILEQIAKKYNNDADTVAKDSSVKALANLARRGRF